MLSNESLFCSCTQDGQRWVRQRRSEWRKLNFTLNLRQSLPKEWWYGVLMEEYLKKTCIIGTTFTMFLNHLLSLLLYSATEKPNFRIMQAFIQQELLLSSFVAINLCLYPSHLAILIFHPLNILRVRWNQYFIQELSPKHLDLPDFYISCLIPTQEEEYCHLRFWKVGFE